MDFFYIPLRVGNQSKKHDAKKIDLTPDAYSRIQSLTLTPKSFLDFFLLWFYNRSKIDLLRRFRMPVNLSIKNVPDHVAEEVRKRAAKHHRSLQGELISILEETIAQEKRMSPARLLKELRALSLKTPSESLKIIRRDRDARSGR
jgi:plasmid stability protein